jgi:hypothetical protein
MALTTREEYENKIAQLQANIVKAQNNFNHEQARLTIHPRERYLTTETKYGNAMCKGGGDACWYFINRDAKQWNEVKNDLHNKITNAKDALWNYQKQIAQEEQEAQIKAVREAIAEQVRIEQEKILQQQKAEQALEKQTAIIEQTTFVNENIQTKETQEQIKSSSLLPLAIVAGVLLL